MLLEFSVGFDLVNNFLQSIYKARAFARLLTHSKSLHQALVHLYLLSTCYIAGVVLGTRDTEMDKIKLPFRCSGEKTDKYTNICDIMI